jgi:transcriptional regulator with XRE-family HTH domain
MKLGGRIRELREQMGLSQRQLAAQAQVSQSYLCQLEREEARNPSVTVLLKLANALYVDPEELLEAAGYTPNRNPGDPERYEPRVLPELVQFLSTLPRETHRHILELLEGMERKKEIDETTT